MPDTTQTRRRDTGDSTSGSRSSSDRNSEDQVCSSPDQLPLSSVPRYMGGSTDQSIAPASQDYNSWEFISDPSTIGSPLPTEDFTGLDQPQSIPEQPPDASVTQAEAASRADADSPASDNAGPEQDRGIDGEASDSAVGNGDYSEQALQSLPAEPDTDGVPSGGNGQQDDETVATQRQRRGGREKKTPLPKRVIPRTGNIVAPRVPPPPKESLKRAAEIRQRTGSPPEMHHAKIQQAVLRVVEAARTGQRQIVRRAANLGKDTRRSLEEMDDEILAFVGGCVQRVRSAVTQAKSNITDAVDAQLEHLSTHEILVGDELTQSKQENQAQVHASLMAESEELNQAHNQLQKEFSPYLEKAQTNIKGIPKVGDAFHIVPPTGGAEDASTDANMSMMPSGPTDDLGTVLKDLKAELLTMRGSNALGNYHATRITPVMQSQHDATETSLQENLNRQASSLDSYRAQFTNYALRLTTPLARDFQQDRRQDTEILECRIDDDRQTLALIVGEHGETLMHKYGGVIAHLDEELQPRLVEGLQKAGHKAARSFREQGKITERMMLNTSASLALAYPELIARVAELLPAERFLNVEELAPRLVAAWESARSLPDQQYAAMAEQAAQSLAQAREGQKKQIQAIGETADKSLQSVTDVVTATRFDFDNFGYQVTGRMREGGWDSVTNAANYAQRMAEQMLETRGQADDALIKLIRNFCVSLNGAIDNAASGYFQAVDRFKQSQISGGNSVFMRIKKELNGDLSKRSQKLNAELTKPDPDVTTGLVVLNVLTLGATTAVTAGYLIYSDADDDEIFIELGSLRWPGQPALAYYFEHNGGYGDLLERIDDCLSESAARRARNMFSSDARTRWRGRRDAVQDSFNLFGLDSDARRSLLQGLGEGERRAAGQAELDALSRQIRDSWTAWFSSDTTLRMNEGYLRGDIGAVLSARMEASLRDARGKSSDQIFQSVQNIEQMAREELSRGASGQFLTPQQIQTLTDQAMQNFASHRRGETRRAGEIGVTEARQTFIGAATQEMVLHHGGGGGRGGGGPMIVPVDQMVQDYVQEVVSGGWQSEEALAARQAYEFSHAGRGSSGPSETDQNRFTRAFQDPELARMERELREHPERRDQIMPELERLRLRREERMRRVARRLNPELTDEQIDRAGGGTDYMAQRAAVLFSGQEYDTSSGRSRRRSDAQEDAQYAHELVSGGRASLAAGIRLATRGVGTNEDLLRMNFQGRSKAEIAEARTTWQDRYGENMDEMLGIRPRRFTPGMMAVSLLSPAAGMFLYGGETSGDLAMEIERLARGEPETDQDFIELAALSYNQQRRRGTGFLARLTMSNTAEARVIDDNHQSMANELLAEARRRRALRANDPNLSSAADIRLPEDPDGVFLPDGRVNPVIASLVFAPGPGSRGRSATPRFLGNRNLMLSMSHEVELAGQRYQAELDRQESLMLAGITALAIAVTVILMAFGVGFVLASVLVALGSGLLTMAVKGGMRGERYGWEEAATDAANTAIEVAAAGAGGALAGGLGNAGRLAAAGRALVTRFGPVGGVVAREAIVGAVSSAAQTSIQDDTYKDGPGTAFGRILLGGVKGASISAVSAGVSESIGNRMNRSLTGALEGADPGRIARLGQGLGPSGRNMLKEGVSEALGGMAGEATGIYIEVISGQYKGGLQGALKRIGQGGLKDMVSATGRAGVSSRNRRTFNDLMAEARANPRLTDSDLRALRAASVAAGEPPDSIDSIRRQVESDRQAITQLPPELQRHAASMDSHSLQSMVNMLQRGELGQTSGARHELFTGISEKNPRLDTDALLRDLESNSARIRREADSADTEQQARLRNDLTEQLPGPVRDALSGMPVHGLENIPTGEMPKVARMLAEGVMDPRQAENLIRAARARNPDMDAVTFLRNLQSAVQSARMAQDAHTRVLARQRAKLFQDLPMDAVGLFSRLPDDDISSVRGLLDQGKTASPGQQEALFRRAQAIDPTLERSQFKEMLDQAASNAAARQQSERRAAREERQRYMTNVPRDQRGTLSVLPEAAQVELHLRQMEGSISPAERLKLQEAALRENPDLDLPAFHKALDAAIEQGAPVRPGAEEAQQMRSELESLLSPQQRTLLTDVPILILPDTAFAAYTRSSKGNAVTLIVNGRAVVVIREGADPSALREEGLHALQSKDPRWAERIGSLDERQLGRWDDLPLDMQMALYRNKLELEIDAHDRMVDSLANDLLRSSDPEQTARLRIELELAQRTLSNLENRMAEVAGIGPMQRLAISAGMLSRPQWLDQPARLFSKLSAEEVATRKQELLETVASNIKAEGSEYRDIRSRINKLDLNPLNQLMELGLSPNDMRRILKADKAPADIEALIGQLHDLSSRLPEGESAPLLNRLIRKSDLAQLAPRLDHIARQLPDAASARQLLSAIINLSDHHLDAAKNVSGYLTRADADQRREFVELVNNIGSEGRGSLMRLLGEMDKTLGKLGADPNETQPIIAGLIRTASGGSVSQRVDLIDRAHSLLTALLGDSDPAPRQAVIDHILDGFTGGGDTHAHALDLRSASRLLVDGALPLPVLARFHRSLVSGSDFLAGGDAYQLHLADKLAGWNDFRQAHPEFAGLLDSTLGHLPEAQRAALADMEPWFSRIVESDWFQERVRRSGNSTEQEQANLLREIFIHGLRLDLDLSKLPDSIAATLRTRGSQRDAYIQTKTEAILRGEISLKDAPELKDRFDVHRFDTLRHIMGELRDQTLHTGDEPDLTARVREQMRSLGFDDAALTQRHSDEGFQKVLDRSRRAGTVPPEIHLEGLVVQRIAYQHMIDTARDIAAQRHPGDADARREMTNRLTAGLQQKVTETTGEIAATRAVMAEPEFNGMQLLRGFEAGTGFDQVWVRRDNNGEVTEILIVEAKGPGAAIQQTRTKGRQMSAEWIAKTSAEMIMRGDDGTGTLIHNAIRSGRPPISGIVVQATSNNGTPGPIQAAKGTKGRRHHYQIDELRRHNPLKDPSPESMAEQVRARIAEMSDDQFRFRYDETEVSNIVRRGRELGLTNTEIGNLMLTGSRKEKPIDADDLMRQML